MYLNAVSDLNDFSPVALNIILRKCFVKLAVRYIKGYNPAGPDPYKSAVKTNRLTEDGISTDLISFLTRLSEKKQNKLLLNTVCWFLLKLSFPWKGELPALPAQRPSHTQHRKLLQVHPKHYLHISTEPQRFHLNSGISASFKGRQKTRNNKQTNKKHCCYSQIFKKQNSGKTYWDISCYILALELSPGQEITSILNIPAWKIVLFLWLQ